MEDAGELINLAVVERVILALALALPLLGLLGGLAWGASHRRVAAGAVRGFALGFSGPAILVLWRVYNAITDHYGLDSVQGLLINLSLFVAIGIGAGLLIGFLRPRRVPAAPSAEPDS
jgi:hypothetical protein